MSQKPVKFKLVKTDNTDLKGFDAKVLLIVARYEEQQKKVELEEMNRKITEVDQLLLQEQLNGNPTVVDVQKNHEEQQVYSEKESAVAAQPPVVQTANFDGNTCNVRKVAPAVDRPQSVMNRAMSRKSRSAAITVSGATGFDLISQAELHKVFSESGKVVDIIRSEDGLGVIVVFDSIASAISAVKHAPDSIEGVQVLFNHT